MAEKKSYSWAYPLIIIGGLAIGAYLIWNWIQKSPVAQAVNTITNTVERVTERLTTPMITYQITNPATNQPLTINAPAPINYIVPPTGIPGFIDYSQKAGEYQAGVIAKTAGTVMGTLSSPSATEATKNVLLDFITGGFIKSGSGLITPPIEQKTVISSPQGTYVATSPIVGINWQTTSVLSQPVKDVLTALQTKTLTQQGFVTQPVGTRIVATNAEVKPVATVDISTGTITHGTEIVPKTTVSAPLTAPKPSVPIAPVLTSVVSQPSYIKPTLISGSGAYAKPGGM